MQVVRPSHLLLWTTVKCYFFWTLAAEGASYIAEMALAFRQFNGVDLEENSSETVLYYSLPDAVITSRSYSAFFSALPMQQIVHQ